MTTLGNNNPAFLKSFYECKQCDFFSSKKSHYNEHILTLKHQKSLLGDIQLTEKAEIRPDDYKCEICSTTYKSRNGLWKHKKKCLEDNDKIKESVITDKELIVMLVKQNSQLMDALKNGTNNTINTNNTNIIRNNTSQ